MKVILSYSHKDYNLAWYAASVMLAHTDMKPENLVLYASKKAPLPPKALSGIATLQCEGDNERYPLGPNIMVASLFQSVAMGHFGERVFLIEPDGFPTCKDWYNKVLKAHLDTNAWVSGFLVHWVNPIHYNGNLVIEAEYVKQNPCLARPVLDAWDCHHAELLVRGGAINPEIVSPQRLIQSYPTKWWKQHKAAWVHGCQNFQMWEDIERNGFNEG